MAQLQEDFMKCTKETSPRPYGAAPGRVSFTASGTGRSALKRHHRDLVAQLQEEFPSLRVVLTASGSRVGVGWEWGESGRIRFLNPVNCLKSAISLPSFYSFTDHEKRETFHSRDANKWMTLTVLFLTIVTFSTDEKCAFGHF